MKIRFPRTWGGWKRLFWLTLRRCPIHHTRLCVDPWPPYDFNVRYCFKCEGISIWHVGFFNVLRVNYQAAKQATPDLTGGEGWTQEQEN
jgi:hypothetical protein